VNDTKDKKHSSAVYAAAGIGELAYQQLRKIPALAEDLRTKAGQLREQGPSWRAQATDKAAELAGKVDVEKIRTALVTNAQKAAEKAASLYEDLVARGEKVVDNGEPAKVVDIDVEAATAKAQSVTAQTVKPAPAAPKVATRKPKATGQK
jgi:hypothetical protein